MAPWSSRRKVLVADVLRCANPACGRPIERRPNGRPACYCSASCRQAARRERLRQAEAERQRPERLGADRAVPDRCRGAIQVAVLRAHDHAAYQEAPIPREVAAATAPLVTKQLIARAGRQGSPTEKPASRRPCGSSWIKATPRRALGLRRREHGLPGRGRSPEPAGIRPPGRGPIDSTTQASTVPFVSFCELQSGSSQRISPDRPSAAAAPGGQQQGPPAPAEHLANIKTIAAEPCKIVYVLSESALAQLPIVLALGASLHAVGQHASIATLITVNTPAAIIGRAVSAPGGLGAVETGLIAGLASVGVPEDGAVAAVLIQRFFTAYLPRSGARRPWPGCAAANTYDPHG